MTTTVAVTFLRKGRFPIVSLDQLVGKNEPTCAGSDEAPARALLWQAVERLPEPESTALRLRFHDGLTLAEAARLMDVSLRTAKFHNARGLALLQGKL